MLNMEVMTIFDSISPSPEDFAKKYNLTIEKYWNGWSFWRMRFKNPKQGFSNLEIVLYPGLEFKVGGYWWVDDYDNGIRFGKKYKSGFIKSNQVNEVLEETLRIVLNWELNSWDEIWTEDLKESWHRRSKEEFYTYDKDKYPEINLNS